MHIGSRKGVYKKPHESLLGDSGPCRAPYDYSYHNIIIILCRETGTLVGLIVCNLESH